MVLATANSPNLKIPWFPTTVASVTAQSCLEQPPWTLFKPRVPLSHSRDKFNEREGTKFINQFKTDYKQNMVIKRKKPPDSRDSCISMCPALPGLQMRPKLSLNCSKSKDTAAFKSSISLSFVRYKTSSDQLGFR